MRGSDFESIDNYQNDQQNNMGVDSGSYDPAGDSSAALTGGARIAEDIQNRNIGGGGDTYNAKQALQSARGITATNPYGYNNPFQGIADFFGGDVNYNNIMSQGDMDSIAEKNYANYVNPMNERNKPGFNNQIPANQARLQTPFGMPFGSPAGTQTQMGAYAEQKPDPLSFNDTAALTGMSFVSGGLPSIFANTMSNRSTFTPRGAPNYQGSRNPLDDRYDKDKYDKSYFESSIDTLLGTGFSGQVKSGLSNALEYLNKPKAGEEIPDLVKAAIEKSLAEGTSISGSGGGTQSLSEINQTFNERNNVNTRGNVGYSNNGLQNAGFNLGDLNQQLKNQTGTGIEGLFKGFEKPVVNTDILPSRFKDSSGNLEMDLYGKNVLSTKNDGTLTNKTRFGDGNRLNTSINNLVGSDKGLSFNFSDQAGTKLNTGNVFDENGFPINLSGRSGPVTFGSSGYLDRNNGFNLNNTNVGYQGENFKGNMNISGNKQPSFSTSGNIPFNDNSNINLSSRGGFEGLGSLGAEYTTPGPFGLGTFSAGARQNFDGYNPLGRTDLNINYGINSKF